MIGAKEGIDLTGSIKAIRISSGEAESPDS
jgi:hypothetical protein